MERTRQEWSGMEGRGLVHNLIFIGMAWKGADGSGKARSGADGIGLARRGQVRHGLEGLGLNLIKIEKGYPFLDSLFISAELRETMM